MDIIDCIKENNQEIIKTIKKIEIDNEHENYEIYYLSNLSDEKFEKWYNINKKLKFQNSLEGKLAKVKLRNKMEAARYHRIENGLNDVIDPEDQECKNFDKISKKLEDGCKKN